MPSNNKPFCGLALENDPMPQHKSFCRVSDNNKPRKFVFQAKKAFGGCCRPMLLRFISNKSPWLQGGSAWLTSGEEGLDAIRIRSLRLLLLMMGPLLLGCCKQGMHASHVGIHKSFLSKRALHYFFISMHRGWMFKWFEPVLCK